MSEEWEYRCVECGVPLNRSRADDIHQPNEATCDECYRKKREREQEED